MSRIAEVYQALEYLFNKLTPQINGMDETCWTIGLHEQVPDSMYEWISGILDDE